MILESKDPRVIPAQLELRGAKGDTGAQGPQGNQGIPGENAHYVKVVGSNYDYSQAGKDEGLWLNGTKLTSE